MVNVVYVVYAVVGSVWCVVCGMCVVVVCVVCTVVCVVGCSSLLGGSLLTLGDLLGDDGASVDRLGRVGRDLVDEALVKHDGDGSTGNRAVDTHPLRDDRGGDQAVLGDLRHDPLVCLLIGKHSVHDLVAGLCFGPLLACRSSSSVCASNV